MRDVLGIKTVCLFQDEGTHHNLFHFWIFPRYEWMGKFGIKIESIRPIINYSLENMINDKAYKEVKENVKKMKEFMK